MGESNDNPLWSTFFLYDVCPGRFYFDQAKCSYYSVGAALKRIEREREDIPRRRTVPVLSRVMGPPNEAMVRCGCEGRFFWCV